MAAETKYNLRELLACNGARVLEDKKSVFVGTGLPMIAAMLAQKTHAPELLMVFEAGSLGPSIPELPISVADSRTFYKGIAASSMHGCYVTRTGGICRLWIFGRCPDGYVREYQHHHDRRRLV